MTMEDRPESGAAPSADRAKTNQATRQATNQAAVALELPFVLVGTIALGAALGYFLDRWMHTKPIFMFVLGALGFAGGVREILRRLPGGTDGAKPS
jgi:F0F1-type ATP synthase assembly protein I